MGNMSYLWTGLVWLMVGASALVILALVVALLDAWLGAVVGVALYLLPSIVARQVQHHNVVAIVVLNVLLGWTLLGWIGALVWALKPSPPVNS